MPASVQARTSEPRRLRRRQIAGAVGLAALPTVLAFFSGGFFDKPRLIAAIVVWALVAVASLAGLLWLPGSGSGRTALAGLALLTAWTLASIAWAPLAGRALDDAQRSLLYLGTFLLATALLRARPAARLLEPALAAGVAIVVGYALAGRLLPGIVHEEPSRQAFGRLDQPLTYWNALGAMAALGLVLCARLAADPERPRALRAAATAAAPALGAGLYLTFSRGALAAGVAGLVLLAVLLPAAGQLAGVARVVAGGFAGGLAVAFFSQVTDPRTPGSGATQGAIALVLLLALSGAAAAAGAREPGDRATRRVALPAGIAAAVLVAGAAAVLLFAGLGGERVARDPSAGPNASRLGSLESQRYNYWKVAASSFADHPLAGTGSGGFLVEWRRERPAGSAPAADAHSLYLETAAELGLVGLALLALFIGGVAATGVRVMRRDPALAAGPLAVLAVWALHAGLDWDWEMPAVTLVALPLAALLVAADP